MSRDIGGVHVSRNISALPMWVRAYRLFFGLLTIVAMAYQYYDGSKDDSFSPGNFFSFFTIQSNIIAAVVLLVGASGASFVVRPTFTWDLVRGAAAIYMALTFIVYGLLLSDISEELQTVIPWINNVVHRIVPIVMVIDFLIRPLLHRITFRQALAWAVYPIVWLVYTIIRGNATDWYPYPFLDPDKVGSWLGVAAICFCIMIGFFAVTWFMTAIGQRLSIRMVEHIQGKDRAQAS